MISEVIFALFHIREYSGGFIEAYKENRELKKLFKSLLKEQESRHKLIEVLRLK